jgi:Holliday junction resolvase
MNKPKAKGTARETWLVNKFLAAGIQAKRAPNNLPSRDVDVVIGDTPVPIEVKDRGQLNLQLTLKEVIDRWGFGAVVWHRTKPGGKKRVPVGPTIIAMDIDHFIRLVNALTGENDGDVGE